MRECHPSAEDTYARPQKEIKIASLSLGGERFIAQQVKPGSWSVLDRRHRELVGSDDKSHERAEQRAAASNAANARLQLEGHQLEKRERDELNASLQTEHA
jgi:hypothetical protein